MSTLCARLVALCVAGSAWTACHGSGSNPPQPMPPSSPFHLYVGNGLAAGGVRQYNLPISSGSLPNFAIATLPQVTAVAQNTNPSGELAVGTNLGAIRFFPQPYSASSTPSLAFSNGTALKVGQIFFDSGIMLAATGDTYVNRFSAPFGSSTPVPISGGSLMGQSFGVVRDVAGVVYIAGISTLPGGGSVVAQVPTSGPTLTTAPQFACIYGAIALSASKLFAPCYDSAGIGPGRIDAYALPITSGAVPAFSMTNGVNGPIGVAFDSFGNLYVGNELNATVTMYQAPISAGSPVNVTLPVSGYDVHAIAIGS